MRRNEFTRALDVFTKGWELDHTNVELQACCEKARNAIGASVDVGDLQVAGGGTPSPPPSSPSRAGPAEPRPTTPSDGIQELNVTANLLRADAAATSAVPTSVTTANVACSSEVEDAASSEYGPRPAHKEPLPLPEFSLEGSDGSLVNGRSLRGCALPGGERGYRLLVHVSPPLHQVHRP